jgi:hypothetical protein
MIELGYNGPRFTYLATVTEERLEESSVTWPSL